MGKVLKQPPRYGRMVACQGNRDIRKQKHNVMVVLGIGFGSPSFFRISYCVDDRVIEGALPRFKKAEEEFGLG